MSSSPRRSPLKLVVIAVVIFFLLAPIVPQLRSIWELHRQMEKLQEQKAELESIQQELQQELKEASSLATVERIAREQLGMVKEGESRIVKIIP
ncbi:MAG: FtsB family cell division protein [Syntrophomonadaceae bacterium]|jgi:cell division protein DivIC